MKLIEEEIHLTINQRILIHLHKYFNKSDQYIVPIHLTQEEIAKNVMIDRKHIPRALKSLIEDELIELKKKHINGKKQKMNTYFLTVKGLKQADKLIDLLFKYKVKYINNKGSKILINFPELYNEFKNKFSICEIISDISTKGYFNPHNIYPEKSDTSISINKAIYIYKNALAQAWKDGHISIDELHLLMNLRKTLNISEKQHIKMENEILKNIQKNTDKNIKEVYKIILSQALSDNKISNDEKAILLKIKKHFNLDDV